MKLKYNGVIKEGKLRINNRTDFDTAMLNIGELEVTLTLEKRSKKRSNPQNSYLWSVVYGCARKAFMDIGYVLTLDEVHKTFQEKFLKTDIVHPDTGEIIANKIKSTTELDTFEFNEYFEAIIRWCAEYLSVEIPYPNEQVEINF